MNRERLTILRDHLASLPDNRVDMGSYVNHPEDRDWFSEPVGQVLHECGSTACIAGWAFALFDPETPETQIGHVASAELLDLSLRQGGALFTPDGWDRGPNAPGRKEAVAAIQSMLDSDDDDALPVWPRVSR